MSAGDYVLWFRPEQVRMVSWAGNPDKPVILENGTARLHPRKSFELWQKAVTLHSRGWKPCEISAVVELKETLRNAMAGEEELRASSRRKEAITELGERALESTDTKSLFLEAVKLVSRTLEVEICRLFQKLPDRDGLIIGADVSPPEIAECLPASSMSDDPLAIFALSSEGPVVVNDLRAEARFDGQRPYNLLGVVGGIAVPLRDRDADHGVLIAYSHRSRRFDQDDVHFLQLIGNILVSAVRRKRIEERLDHESRHDGLTGLPNRVLFIERLEQSLRNIQSPPSLLLIDLDRFKDVNDTFGHHVGDLMLQQVAARLRGNLRAIDTLARLSGDEFVVLLPRTCEKDAVVLAQRLLADLRCSFRFGGTDMRGRREHRCRGRPPSRRRPEHAAASGGCGHVYREAIRRRVRGLLGRPG